MCNVGSAVPIGNTLEILGEAVAAAGVPLETVGSGNTVSIQVQYASAAASSVAANAGVASFSSVQFTVDANGYVMLNGSAVAETITGNTGGALSPVAGNWNILGSSVAAGTTPVHTAGSGNTLTIDVQIAQAIASTNVTNVGLAAFNSAQFTVDANGFVSFSGTGGTETLTGNSGGAVSPTANNINTLGTGSITIVGNPGTSTLTTQLTGLTTHAVLVGAGTATITNVGPTANTGAVLQNNSGADPTYSTATYPSTTTINQILYSSSNNVVAGLATANDGVLTTGTTGIPVVTALGSDGQLIIGSGAGAPAAATLTAGTGISITNGHNSISIAVSGSVVGETITGDSGGALSPTAGNWTFTGGTTGLTFSGAVSTETLTGVLVGANGGTGANNVTTTTGTILRSNGTAFVPSTATYPNIAGTSGNVLTSNGTNWTSSAPATSGTVTSVSVVSANGFAGTVATATTTPAITITTTATGVLSGNGTAISGSAITQHDVLVGGASNAVTSVSPSTAGFVLTSNGTSSDPSFQAVSASGAIITITGNSGGAESPTAGGNFNILGTGSITVAGSANTETVQLTGLTNHAVLVGAGTATITNVGPSSTTGAPLLSEGSSTDPAFSTTLVVADATGGMTQASSQSGAATQWLVSNTSNTSSATSTTVMKIAGSSALGAYSNWNINAVSASNWSAGILGSDGNWYLHQSSSTFGTNPYMKVTQAGAVLFPTVPGTTVSNQEYVTINSSTGQLGVSSGSGNFTSIAYQLITSTGTYTPTAGMLYALVEVVGGGAGGGSASASTSGTGSSTGSGGGGGEYRAAIYSAATIGASQSVTINGGGASASNGGTTVFGALITSNGGTAGSTVTKSTTVTFGAAGGAGGTGGSGGTIVIPGGAGGSGWCSPVGAVYESGYGGSSQLAGSVASLIVLNGGSNQATVGTAGTGYGGGGSGGLSYGNSAAANGGAGSGGCVKITEFI